MKTTFHPWEDGFILDYSDDVEPVMERCKRLQAETSRLPQPKVTWRQVAEIPHVIAMKFREEHGLDILNPEHSERIMQIIRHDPDYKYFRTR